MSATEGEGRGGRAELLARLANACQMIGAMMEAGVDILSITRVVRSQNSDEDILRLCDHIDYDLKIGRAISDAMADEPSLFSPFMVTLIRQGEERSALPQAFARVAQALESERQDLLQASAAPATPAAPPARTPAAREPEAFPQVLARGSQSPGGNAVNAHASAHFEMGSWPDLAPRIEQSGARWLRSAGRIGAALLAASAASEALAVLGLVSPKWQRPLARALSASVLALASRQARQAEPAAEPQASRLVEMPQVLEAAPVAPEEARQPPSAAAAPIVQHQEEEEDQASNAIYTGAPREDEEEEAPRQMRRPRHEEEFD